jgi:hypothetical protein
VTVDHDLCPPGVAIWNVVIKLRFNMSALGLYCGAETNKYLSENHPFLIAEKLVLLSSTNPPTYYFWSADDLQLQLFGQWFKAF